jgi:hypothetical protein
VIDSWPGLCSSFCWWIKMRFCICNHILSLLGLSLSYGAKNVLRVHSIDLTVHHRLLHN